MKDIPRIKYLGQSGFFIESSDIRLLIDPQNKKSGDLDGDLVYSTHSHFDHTGGVETFLGRNPDAIFVCNKQVAKGFAKFGERMKIVRAQESFEFKSTSFNFTKLNHGVFKGVYNLAVEIRMGDFTFAHCGDAVTFEGFPSSSVDVLAMPISGAFAASPKTAMEMILNLSEPLPIIVPMHWLLRNPKSFCKNLQNQRPGVNCVVPSDGEYLAGFD